MESKDGINFEKTTTFRSNFPHYAHNIGVSGNTLGQLDLSITNYIGAAYTPTGDEAWWGHWHTRLAPLYIKTESSATTAKPTTTKPATPTTKPKKPTPLSPAPQSFPGGWSTSYRAPAWFRRKPVPKLRLTVHRKLDFLPVWTPVR